MSKHNEAIDILLENEPKQLFPAVEALLKICENILNDPMNSKFRSINLSSETVTTKLMATVGAFEILFLLGFEEGDDKLILPSDASMSVIRGYRNQLYLLKKKMYEKRASISEEPRASPSILASELQLHAQLEHEIEQQHYFEITHYKTAALDAIPCEELREKAQKMLLIINKDVDKTEGKPMDFQDCLLKALLEWFKMDFFTWFDRGFCKNCHIPMVGIGYLEPIIEERASNANRVEGYQCQKCNQKERFPRYFDPLKLLSTRHGRCMEWASCFTLICKALGMDARYIWDKTDHVWTEVFSNSQDRWLHADCCENKLDSPLMYERGWNKKLSYIFAFSKDEIVDVICRYTANMEDVCTRRKSARQDWLTEALHKINTRIQQKFSNAQKKKLEMRRVKEIAEFFAPPKMIKEGEAEGRLSGSLEWRLSRGESNSSVVPKSYVFIPSNSEVGSHRMIVRYCSASNEYTRPYVKDKGRSLILGWQNGVFSTRRIFRKHEKDWRCVYLAREEGSSEGELKWKVDWTGTELRLVSLCVKLEGVTYENGLLNWQICCDDLCFNGTESGRLDLDGVDLCENTYFTLSAHLSGGKGDVAWQHAQLFRQIETDTTCQLEIDLKFK